MKVLFRKSAIILIFLLLPFLTQANVLLTTLSTPKDHVQLTKDYLKTLHIQALRQDILRITFNQMIKKDKWLGMHKKEFLEFLNKKFSWNNMQPIYVKVNAKYLTDEELRGLIKFYKTPIGKSVVKKVPLIYKDTAIATRRYLDEVKLAFYKFNKQVWLKHVLKKANADNPHMQFTLGQYYWQKKNYKLSLQWYKKAVENHSVEAANEIAAAYNQGLGVSKDQVKAFNWYKKAAVAGDQVAMFNTGLHYFYGVGVKENSQQALYWFKKTAYRDMVYAQYMLAKIYFEGKAVNKNSEQGDNWLTLVAYELYDPYFVGFVKERDLYINTFIAYQRAKILGEKPVYAAGTTDKMIAKAKEFSNHIHKICDPEVVADY